MESKGKSEKNENGPLNLYKKTILWTKLDEAMKELKEQNKINSALEQKIKTLLKELLPRFEIAMIFGFFIAKM